MPEEHREGCASTACAVEDVLDIPHLRVQLSPPGQPWQQLRYCDLICLLEWLEEEASSPTPRIFLKGEWIDSHG